MLAVDDNMGRTDILGIRYVILILRGMPKRFELSE